MSDIIETPSAPVYSEHVVLTMPRSHGSFDEIRRIAVSYLQKRMMLHPKYDTKNNFVVAIMVPDLEDSVDVDDILMRIGISMPSFSDVRGYMFTRADLEYPETESSNLGTWVNAVSVSDVVISLDGPYEHLDGTTLAPDHLFLDVRYTDPKPEEGDDCGAFEGPAL